MEMLDLITYAQRMNKKYPELRSRIDELIQLAKSESEKGGSSKDIYYRTKQSIEKLINSL